MATNARETAKQENGSRVFFEHVIEKGKEPTDKMMIGIYDGYSPEWRDTYRKQTAALKKYLGSNRGYEYSRDSGIMPYIEDIAKKECGVSVKDRWNPMDIVLIKRNMKKVIEGTIRELTNIDGMSKEAKLGLLNAYMRETLKEKHLIGVSLKAIAKNKKTASSEVANAGGISIPTKVDMVKGSLKCTLTLGKKKPFLFDTGELGFDMETAKGGKIHGQSRNFQYSKERNLVQTDLTPKGKDAGAKLGKVSSVALDAFLGGMGLNRPTSAAKDKNIPNILNERVLRIIEKMENDMQRLKLNKDFDLDVNNYLMQTDQTAKLQTPPLPKNVVDTAVNPNVVNSGQIAQLNNGLTMAENALLSEEEKMIKLRQRGMLT